MRTSYLLLAVLVLAFVVVPHLSGISGLLQATLRLGITLVGTVTAIRIVKQVLLGSLEDAAHSSRREASPLN